jgi:PhzF family phenazine biosynthesis protein
MRRSLLFQVDAFTAPDCRGNPAAVMVLESYPDDSWLQALAAHNAVPETAFLVPLGADFRLRWFTPKVEVPLCGHATLASAAVVMERLEPDRRTVVFHTASGALTVQRAGPGYRMDFPARRHRPTTAPPALLDALGASPEQVLCDQFNYLVVFSQAAMVRALAPDLAAIARLDRSGVIVTAPGDQGDDCVSRYFAPAKGIPEDPVTGGAHCALTPYWCERLGKRELRAFQASARGGRLTTRLRGDRVELEGSCTLGETREVER